MKASVVIQWLAGIRYIKFGLVGAGGTVVNMVVLYLAQEHFFATIATIADTRQRLYASLALAIAIATVHNFTWNRLWTWADRVSADGEYPQNGTSIIARQFGRYAMASWLGMALQYGLTLYLSHSLHYLLANGIAIVTASISNFLANDRWTFSYRANK
jgi:putative flippase GtrA